MNDAQIAKLALKCMDLTSLNSNDSIYKIEALCNKAHTSYGNVAALCIYPKFINTVKHKTNIKIATVINFPFGADSVQSIKKDITDAVQLGAQELDIVFPYQAFLAKDFKTVDSFLIMLKSLNKDITSKIILETSELEKLTTIIDATKLCLEAGAGFIKTSTGKSTKGGATPEVANIILETIASHPKKAGFKASGGIKTIEDARKYIILAQAIMGAKWVGPSNFRLGASSLLGDLIKCLSKT